MKGDTWKPLTETQAAGSGPIDPQVNTTDLFKNGGYRARGLPRATQMTIGVAAQEQTSTLGKQQNGGGGTQEVGPTEGGRRRIQEPPSHTASGLRAERINWPELTSRKTHNGPER